MSSDYDISDDENEYYDEEDDEMMDVDDDGTHLPTHGLTNAHVSRYSRLRLCM